MLSSAPEYPIDNPSFMASLHRLSQARPHHHNPSAAGYSGGFFPANHPLAPERLDGRIGKAELSQDFMTVLAQSRSEERRVGKEWRTQRTTHTAKKKNLMPG